MGSYPAIGSKHPYTTLSPLCLSPAISPPLYCIFLPSVYHLLSPLSLAFCFSPLFLPLCLFPSVSAPMSFPLCLPPPSSLCLSSSCSSLYFSLLSVPLFLAVCVSPLSLVICLSPLFPPVFFPPVSPATVFSPVFLLSPVCLVRFQADNFHSFLHKQTDKRQTSVCTMRKR